MSRGRECSRANRNQSHHISKSYQMLIQEGIWKSYILVEVMAMKKGSVVLPVHRECISRNTMVIAKTTKYRKILLLGYKIIQQILYKLVKDLSVPQVDLKRFDGNSLEYTYFMSTFTESVKKKIEEPKGRLTRLIQYTRGEAKDLIIKWQSKIYVQ